LIRRSACFWLPGSQPGSAALRGGAPGRSRLGRRDSAQGKLFLAAFKAIAVMPVSAARGHDLKVEALAEMHPSPIKRAFLLEP
jgi:hypothetical protein